MTVIEFFDQSATENITGALLHAPEKVIYVGDNRHLMEKSLALYRAVLAERNINTALSYKGVNKNKLQNILSILTEIIAKNEDCVFDLTGGEDLFLVAVGILSERYPDKIRAYRFNLNTGITQDALSGATLEHLPRISLSAKENIRLHGGRSIYDMSEALYSADGQIKPDFLIDTDQLWHAVEKSPRLYNTQTNLLGKLDALYGKDDPLSITFSKKEAEKAIAHPLSFDFMQMLQEVGLIENLVWESTVSFRFKNARCKRCLTIAGQVLEFKIAKQLLSLKEEGYPLYTDVRVGVMIDWDAQEGDLYPTRNEIDIIAMKGTLPIFISCKNGDIGTDELYKLSSVAEKFGGKYVKKVLVATEIEKLGAKAEHLRARAADMGIRLLENIDEMSCDKLDRLLQSLWLN